MEKSKTIFKKLLDWGKGDIKTRRYIVVFLGIIIILIVIIVGIVLIFKEPNIKFGSELEITPKQAKEKEQLSAHHKELKEGLQVLKQLPIKSLPRTLKDSIAKLIYLQTTDLNQADELLQTYEIYDKLSKNERIEFIGKVLSYLSEKSHPLRQKNYVEIARRIVSSNNEQMRIDSINRELERSKKRVGEMENLINKLSNKYQIDLQRNNQLLFSLINDSAKNGPRIDSLKSEIIRLREEKEQLLNDMQLYYPLRITNCSFASPGCRSKKDGSYLVGCMGKLELKFVLHSNIPTTKDLNEPLHIIFSLPTNDPSNFDTIERRVLARIGEETIVTFDDPNHEYVPGLYIVQILQERYSKNIPLEIQDLTAKRWLTK